MPARVVVVVHDEPGFADQAAAALRLAGCDPATFADPMAALNALEKAPQVEVLITRVQFGPGQINGIALARMARMKCPGIKVVFTALPEFEPYAAGLGQFLPTPVSVRELAETVRRLLFSPGQTAD